MALKGVTSLPVVKTVMASKWSGAEMANDRQWQRRSDEWVKAIHESRKRKEQARRDALAERYRIAALAAAKPGNPEGRPSSSLSNESMPE